MMNPEELNASMYGLAYIWTMFGWRDSVAAKLIKDNWFDLDVITRIGIWHMIEAAAKKESTILIWQTHSEDCKELLSQLKKPWIDYE